jgi:hypothetical protein
MRNLSHPRMYEERTPPTHLAKTGERFPVGGSWAPVDRHEDQRIFAEGSIMPADKGRSVTGRWLRLYPAGLH